MSQRVIVFGLDCAPPKLIFEEWRGKLPNIDKLIDRGRFGPLRSSDPPITVPAWSSMLSGKSPAELGFYGFKNRKEGTYFEKEFVTSRAVRQNRVWDILGRYGKKSILLGIPQTFPPPAVNGVLVSGFLTPSADSACTYPPELKEEVYKVCPDFMFDVPNYRTGDKRAILDNLQTMARGHFKVFRHLLERKPWDFAMMVEIGTDRIQHCFWNDMDATHPLHDTQSPYKSAIFEYYQMIDSEIGEILKGLKEEPIVFVVSDHGAKSMMGAIALNEWLIQKGYLKLKNMPKNATTIERCEVDWPATTAWGVGGYYGRIYLNVAGREAEGKIPIGDYEKIRKRIAGEIKEIPGINNSALETKVFTPEELYGTRTPNAPDLLVYFDDLRYRCLSSVGTGKVAHLENDTGPDGANHDYEGIFIGAGPGVPGEKNAFTGMRLSDVAKTILDCFDIRDSGVQGKNLLQDSAVVSG